MRFFLFILTLPLLPALSALGAATWQLLFAHPAQNGLFTPGQWTFLGGFTSWIIISFIRRRTAVSYIWAHELTHAIAGLLCGARVHRMVIRRDGGLVELSKDNIFITLSPYLVPFYLLLLLALRLAIQHFFPGLIPEPLWLFGIGFLFSFHLQHTLNALVTVAQPDIQVYGRLFSYSLIAAANLLIIATGLILFYQTPWSAALDLFTGHLIHHYHVVKIAILEIWQASTTRPKF